MYSGADRLRDLHDVFEAVTSGSRSTAGGTWGDALRSGPSIVLRAWAWATWGRTDSPILIDLHAAYQLNYFSLNQWQVFLFWHWQVKVCEDAEHDKHSQLGPEHDGQELKCHTCCQAQTESQDNNKDEGHDPNELQKEGDTYTATDWFKYRVLGPELWESMNFYRQYWRVELYRRDLPPEVTSAGLGFEP